MNNVINGAALIQALKHQQLEEQPLFDREFISEVLFWVLTCTGSWIAGVGAGYLFWG